LRIMVMLCMACDWLLQESLLYFKCNSVEQRKAVTSEAACNRTAFYALINCLNMF
jgi:hypothetical protein